MPDHIHMLVSIPPKMSVSSFMGYLKGKNENNFYNKTGYKEVMESFKKEKNYYKDSLMK